MENKNGKKSIKEGVLEAIQTGRAKMRPRWHFVLRAVLLVVGVSLVFFALLYLASFILFALRETGIWFAPLYGSRGWITFFRSLPWVLIFLSLVFMVVLEILVQRYAFANRKPLLYSVLGIVVLAVLGGIIVAPFHRPFFRSAREHSFPFAGGFYRNFEFARFDDIHRGRIMTITPEGFVLQDLNGETSTVFITSGTRMFPDPDVESGNAVVVFGDQTDHAIQAYGIREINDY